MADIYRANYDNPAGDSFQIDIAKADGSNTVIEQMGARAEILRRQVDGPLIPIRESEAVIELEASSSLDFSDLFTETENQWIVRIQRNSTLIFEGWLQPEDIFEDFVNDVWIMEVRSTDGLGNLKNKAYTDANGDAYEGLTDLRTVLLRCLERTGFTGRDLKFAQASPSTTDFPVRAVETFPSPLQDFWDQQINQRAFLDDDGTPYSCEKVLTNLLGACNGVVFYQDDAWVINWALQHANPVLNGAFQYSVYSGGVGVPSTEDIDVNETIYSQVNAPTAADYFWIQENQRISRRPSIAATRVEYRYRGISAANLNPDLNNNGTTISNWTVNQPGAVTLNDDGTVTVTAGTNPSTPALTNTAVAGSFDAGTFINLVARWSNDVALPNLSTARFKVILSNGGTPYYLVGSATNPDAPPSWTTTDGQLTWSTPPGVGEYAMNYNSPELPITGQVQLIIMDTGGEILTYDYFGVANFAAETGEGITFTAERVTAPSSYIEDTRELVIADDQDGIVYLGTLLLEDGTTKTTEGYITPTSAFAFPLYQKGLVDRLRLRGKPVRLFSGSVYGYVPYNSRLAIDGFTGMQFVFTEWSYDTGLGITFGSMFQLVWDDDDADDTDYTVSENYGNIVEPKIRG